MRIQKSYGSSLATDEMVIARFQISNKFDRIRFFQKTFLLIDSIVNIILEMIFLTFNNVNIVFAD